MRDSKNTIADGTGSAPASPPAAAHHYDCRARRTGFGENVVCLEPPPQDCGYALHMGDEYLCLHPHHLEIVTQAEARRTA